MKPPESPWKHSTLLERAQVAKDWGKTPSEFDALSMLDKAVMIAYTRTTGQMAAWENYQETLKAKGTRKRGRSRHDGDD